MKLIIVFNCFILPAILADYTFETKFINVSLDHYSFTTDYKFPLRYLINDTFHDGKGPIFFYTGNEGNVEVFAQNTGFMFDIAPQFNALIVFAEHRYYGESWPFGNESFISPSKLGYLSISQVLGDYVYLINYLQKTYTAADAKYKIPAIAFGGSYGGGLSIYLKMKFPHSIIGALASSAPIWNFKGQNPCNLYSKTVTEDFRKLGGEYAVKAINSSWTRIREFAKTENGKELLTEAFKLCDPIETDWDVEILLGFLGGMYCGLAQYNYPYPSTFSGINLPGDPLQKFASKINFEFEDDYSLIKAFGEGFGVYTNYTGTNECNQIKNTAEPKLGDNAWGFQTCNELMGESCSRDDDFFENFESDLDSYFEGCYETYGVRPRGAEVPILEFGGKDLSTANNVIFSNGLVDPYSGFGILANYTPNMLAIVMPDTAHHLDLRAADERDPESVRVARKIYVNQFTKWIQEYDEEKSRYFV